MREVIDIFDRFVGRKCGYTRTDDREGSVAIHFLLGAEKRQTLLRFYHDQDCCEHVRLIDCTPALSTLCNKTIKDISLSYDIPPDDNEYELSPGDSRTWTTVTIKTMEDDTPVVLRWLGTSNGYYNESIYAAEETGERVL